MLSGKRTFLGMAALIARALDEWEESSLSSSGVKEVIAELDSFLV